MSEKHLTELAWKTIVIREGVKDPGLHKALCAYSKIDDNKEPAKALDALKDISDLALKLKKTCADIEDVVEHLDEMLKEVKKITPVLEAKNKSATKLAEKAAPKQGEEDVDNEEEKEAAEFKKDLKKQMVSALAQVKLRAPTPDKEPKPQMKFMAYLAGKGSAVIVARKVGSATKKLLPDLAGGVSGGKFVLGECIFEKNAYTFVLEQIPGGLAKSLAAALQTETGQKYAVRARTTDGSEALDAETDTGQDTTTSSKGPAEDWKTKLDTSTPAIKEAMAARGPDAGKMAKLYGQALTLSKIDGKMAEALTALADCYRLATAWAEAEKKKQGSTTSQPDPKAAQWKDRDSKFVPHLKTFLQAGIGDIATVKTQYNAATAAAGKSDYGAALEILNKLEPMVVRGAASGIVGWQKARIEVINQIRQLQTALVKTKRPISLEIAKELESVPNGLKIIPDTAENLKALETYLTTDEVIDKIETLANPLGIKIGIREPLLKAMAGLTA